MNKKTIGKNCYMRRRRKRRKKEEMEEKEEWRWYTHLSDAASSPLCE